MELSLFDAGRDSLEEITLLLHRAYRSLATAGMNYVAATQTVDVTQRRIEHAACCWVARRGAEIVGTISYYCTPPAEIVPAWYLRSEVGHFAQFAVEPSLQRAGIGTALLRTVEHRAAAEGKAELACDTAASATHLIAYYERLGFRAVATHKWPHAVYASVVLSKTLTPEAAIIRSGRARRRCNRAASSRRRR